MACEPDWYLPPTLNASVLGMSALGELRKKSSAPSPSGPETRRVRTAPMNP
jgi:hypothetical protein